MNIKRYLAHSATEKRPEGQPLKEHLNNVACLTARFCKPFGAENDGRLCGLYHDIGKYSDKFQKRLNGSKEMVDHSSAGALLLFDKSNVPAAMCIAGHHAGLADLGTKICPDDTFMGRIKRVRDGEIENCEAWRTELPADIPSGYVSRPGVGLYFYIKMLFSALTDADWLDTEAYFEDRPVVIPEHDIKVLAGKLDAFVSRWDAPMTEINRRRSAILQAAVAHGEDDPGLFTMKVPTGGGKTVSSMAFALRHAIRHGLRRIIYVIPYCSILEQTQQVFENIFGKDAITAHYSGAEYEADENSENKQFFSVENWEAPIILTTAVQFFESLFSARPGKNRKLHNIARSVIVFDEAQMLPVPFLRPCLAAISQLVESFGCSGVLCTATQPDLEPIIKEFLPGRPLRELCPEPEKMYEAFRRVRYVNEGELSDEELTEQLKQLRQVLCVVNSRRQAQELYHALGTCGGNYHLSTTLTPYDRKRILREIRERLKDGQDCRVISTSLIEAGVDVDFPVVYRALAGLDSIIQSGGRCNREGSRSADESVVHIFRTTAKSPKMLEQNVCAASDTLEKYDQADSPEAIRSYFHFLYYTLKDQKQLDANNILADAKNLKFETAAKHFRMIDGADYTIYIPVGEGERLIDELRNAGPSRRLLRELNLYGVNVYPELFDQFCESGSLELVKETKNAGILRDPELYSPETGLRLEVSNHSDALFI